MRNVYRGFVEKSAAKSKENNKKARLFQPCVFIVPVQRATGVLWVSFAPRLSFLI
jgi:hypothetical protein